jgi:hypothetical protein
MPERVADLCRKIQEEHDAKKFTALIEELIRRFDEERAIKARFAGSLHNRNVFSKRGANSETK